MSTAVQKIVNEVFFGEKFLKICTLGCNYDLDRCVGKLKKHFDNSDVDLFCVLVNVLKNSVTENWYNQ